MIADRVPLPGVRLHYPLYGQGTVRINPNKRKPIFLIGAPRSGTTWVSHVISSCPGLSIVEEPDNWFKPYACVRMTNAGSFPTLSSIEASYWEIWDYAFGIKLNSPLRKVRRRLEKHFTPKSFESVAIRLVREQGSVYDHTWRLLNKSFALPTLGPSPQVSTAVVKSVFSCFLAEEIANRYAANVVVVRRNLLNGASSWYRLKYGRDLHFENSGPVRKLIEDYNLTPPSNNDLFSPAANAWMYAILDTFHLCLLRRNSDWISASHSVLAANPSVEFPKLFRQLELPYTRKTSDWLSLVDCASENDYEPRRASSAESEKWKRILTSQEADEMCTVLRQFPQFDVDR